MTIFVILVILAVLFLTPTVGVLLSSVKTTRAIALGDLWSLPSELYLGNFTEVLSNPAVHRYFINTLLVTVPAPPSRPRSACSRATSSPSSRSAAATSCSSSLVAGMFFPPQVILVPLFRLFNGLGLIDTLWPIFLVHTALGIPICTLLMRNFFATVPNALREAAILEGANEWQVLTRVALPLSLPALAVLATLQFTWIWNDFLWPLIFTQSDDKRTIMVGIVNLRGQYTVAWGVQGALSLIASLPTLVIFLFFQRYFIKGMTMGAVKG